MTKKETPQPDLKLIMKGLKDFQRETVKYVFKRLYQDPDKTSRFLIADEVGLGKTLVARGLIATVVDHLWKDTKRIDIIYICSNQEIAQQNIDRLNITQDSTFQHTSRATLLPITLHELKNNKLNFVSLTPGTSFNLSSKTGWSWERIVLFSLLRKAWKSVSVPALSDILRGDVSKERWKGQLNWFKQNEKIDRTLAKDFIRVLSSQPEFHKRFKELAIHRTRTDPQHRSARKNFIQDLRRLLAKSSLAALQPDLIILDEFQRFKYLLDEENELSLLAQELFNYKDDAGRPAKVLLLSATPYKMYTQQGEDENHYEDFLQTINFLSNGNTIEIEKLKNNIGQYRKTFLEWKENPDSHKLLLEAKKSIESILRKVMVRTERLAASADRNGMLTESKDTQNNLHPDDLVAFAHLDHIAQNLKVENQIEYWKSSAYPLNLMEGYKLKRQFQHAIPKAASNGLYSLLEQSQKNLLHWKDIRRYQKIDPGNARLRTLISQTIETDNWKLLWLPANLPYYHPEGPYTNVSKNGFTKSLVFSSWQIVPKMIATLLSYEAEQNIMRMEKRSFSYDELNQKRKPLLHFNLKQGTPTGLSIFTLIYPCLTLAKEFDPLILAAQAEDNSLSSSSDMLQKIKVRLHLLLEKATESMIIVDKGHVDESWYWCAPIILDRYFHHGVVEDWFFQGDTLAWENMLKTDSEKEDESGFFDHVIELTCAFDEIPNLGRRPEDLLDVLAKMAIASPAVTALRSIMRVTGAKSITPEFLAAAAQTGLGFRSLFNQPDTIVLLQSLSKEMPKREHVYWRMVLAYCLQGNLQAVLDEYVHILQESLGLVDHDPEEAATKFGNILRQALSLRSPSLRFDEIKIKKNVQSVKLEEHGIRCRYAIRFGNDNNFKLEDGTRDTDIRVAFNSPFRPFVLATTSVGQEGLDFHQYCHKVVHWNLPTNPVDLEQREGRVHRYKGHVIRRNLADAYSLASLQISSSPKMMDPWKKIFELARKNRSSTSSDLEPYWIFEGPYRIERIIPLLPLSREIDRLNDLKDALVAYRSVIGQPRQQELMETLKLRMSEEELINITSSYSIDLSPPKSR
jgi:hypothetical protein